ncbi:glycosyl hydrolase 115 family protein [Pedobacter soli]|uniref:Glycosyl hydrolase family 115 n=1 Tax=Pedobacter soli TaxID=390242 RepID=A0A1G6YNH4_9SPHI|nr:glycosyl hydrolase 115 family protein [Pedobacter soli]SDD91861.1 Glycosyl hydrolase family 115 [Pedobacter soli]
MKWSKLFLLAGLILFLISGQTWAQKSVLTVTETNSQLAFPVVDAGKATSIYIDGKDADVVAIAAEAFKGDINLLTGLSPEVLKNSSSLSTYPIIIGTLGQSAYIDQLVKAGKINESVLRGKWETFCISVIENPVKGVKRALVIAGSDRRGTAFGVFELSRRFGVSPLCWWADVKPARKKNLYLQAGQSLVQSPSVKYRGIFINDEDWGIQPWAAKMMDADVKDIGPKTYTKIFELLLRLKANYIWPGMHPSTKAFYHYANNPVMADKYAIVLGSSHCEPMLRNNVFEWAENFEQEYGKKPGEWRYDLNKNEIEKYWTDRVVQAKNYESVYTVGMRGIHDGSMPGPKDKNEKVKLLGEVIADQRTILSKNITQPISSIPQIFCPYKEVLSLYQAGLKLPDDVTIVWADDNHGYIRQLSDPEEQKRPGGSGVYYHISYWGAPQDYLWLSSISPSLISYELTKAYQYKANRLWVINVGDIKPAEMETQFAMDLAWDIDQWKPEKAWQYAESWAAETFGTEFAKPIANIKAVYYRLGHEAKPEHMGSVNFTSEQAEERLAAYAKIYAEASALNDKIPARLKDAYFELILYPVQGAMLMNQKILYAQKSLALAINGDQAALDYAQKAKAAFEEIQLITKKYNQEIAGGKWNGMMSWKPRDLAVFKMPKVAESVAPVGTTKATVETENKTIIRASQYLEKSAPKGLTLQSIKGLGIGGDGISCYPFTFKPVADNALQNAAYAVYQVDFKATGQHLVTVKCLPTQGVNEDVKVRYAISINDDKPQVVNLSPASENNIWKQNVLQGYATGLTRHEITKTGKSTVKIYLLDPGLVINQLEIK